MSIQRSIDGGGGSDLASMGFPKDRFHIEVDGG